MIQLHDKQFVPFISAKEIDLAITKMTVQITTDFSDEIPVFIVGYGLDYDGLGRNLSEVDQLKN